MPKKEQLPMHHTSKRFFLKEKKKTKKLQTAARHKTRKYSKMELCVCSIYVPRKNNNNDNPSDSYGLYIDNIYIYTRKI